MKPAEKRGKAAEQTDRTASRFARSHRAGLAGEGVAALLLLAKGYRILARRYRAGGGEIDLVVRRGDVIAFVEVKARPLVGDAATAITPQKLARLTRAARAWVGRNPWATAMTLRCDAVFLGRRAFPRHVKDVYPLPVA